ncbi:MAG: methyl-accepting chemotaxis protein [Beijerinckiaceae bacterium]|nr:methyl-accepting chemotaxis protein [Beijerinckiaceae bacterium]
MISLLGRLSITRLSIARQFTVLAILGLVLTLAGLGLALKRNYDLAFDAKRAEVRHILENSGTLVHLFVEKARSGAMSTADAQRLALEAVAAQHYDNGNYIFVLNGQGVMLAHPDKQIIGTNRMNSIDSSGIFMSRRIVETIKSGHPEFQYYLHTRRDGAVPVLKMAYAAAVPEWDWIVATGIYVDDIEAEMIGSVTGFAEIFIPLCGGALVIALLIRKSIANLIGSLTHTMQAMAAGELEVPIAGTARRDEIGRMSLAVQVFRDNAVKLREMEARRAKVEADRQMVMTSIGMGLDRLARGDLNCGLSDTFPSEYGKLWADFNATADSLRTALSSIARSTQAIAIGTDEIALASQDLSRRNEQQAVSLDQTATELRLITKNVEKMAAGASEASHAVTATRHAVETSGSIVFHATEAMRNIKDSSHRIGQIVAMIDDIAFRTNLLSLNAEIEAASAGEAGRGFAVVASEVRGLAQRSKEAADEIKALISSSTEQVESGVDLVGKTGAALKEVIGQASIIDTLVLDISKYAQAQAASLAEINRVMSQIDKTTQQNTAMAEEATAASNSLASEAANLAGLVGRFRLGGDVPAPARSSLAA